MIMLLGCIIQQPPPPTAQQIAAQIERDYATSTPQITATPALPAEQSPSSNIASGEGPRQPSAMARAQAVSTIKSLSDAESCERAANMLFAEQTSFIRNGMAGNEANAMGVLAAALHSLASGPTAAGFVLLCTPDNIHWSPIIAHDFDRMAETTWTPTESAGLTDQQMADFDVTLAFTSDLVSNVPKTCSKILAGGSQEHHSKHHHPPASSAVPPDGMHDL